MDSTLDNIYDVTLSEDISITDLGGSDIVTLGETMLNIVFEQREDDLSVRSILSGNTLTINDWFISTDRQIEGFITSDEIELSGKQVQLMIDEMATFGTESGILGEEINANSTLNNESTTQMWVVE